jgi:hypothetical protein
VLAGSQRLHDQLVVGPALGQHRDRVDVVAGQHLLEAGERPVQVQSVDQRGGALGQQVRGVHRLDVGMELPELGEAASELATAADTDLHVSNLGRSSPSVPPQAQPVINDSDSPAR